MNGPFGSSPLPGLTSPAASHLHEFLIRAGWTRVRRVAGSYEIWSSHPDTSSGDGLLVPIDPEREDYRILYGRALDELRRRLTPASYQVLDAQLALEAQHNLVPTSWKHGAATTPGTIPWLDGQSVHVSITRQLAAAAKATIEPRAQLGRSNSYIAQDFLAAAVLAPSGVGSYVVTALTPRHQPIFMSPPAATPPGRRPRERPAIEAIAVVRTLDSALDAVTTALNQTSTEDAVHAMTDSIERGVSSELVAALADFTRGVESAVILPRYAWDYTETNREYSFTPTHSLRLEAGARALAATAEPHRATITGVVTFMKHEPESEERTVQVSTTSRGPVRRVRLQLSEEDYEAAVDAHKSGALVRVTGQLTKPAKFWTMDSPEAFDAIDTEGMRLDDETEDLFTYDDGKEYDTRPQNMGTNDSIVENGAHESPTEGIN